VSDLFYLLAWISISVGHRVGLQTHDLLPLVDVILELSSLGLKLLALHPLFSYLSSQLEFGIIDSFDPLLSIFFKLLDLVFKSLFIFLVFLLMLALDDFLSLLCDTIQLNILGSFFEIFDFEIESFFLIFDSFEASLEFADSIHQLYLCITSCMNFFVFILNHIS